MHIHYTFKPIKYLTLLVFILSTGTHYCQNFSQSSLNFNGIGSVNQTTSLMYGPDGRLYVAEYPGLIKILTVERIGNSNYMVTAMETLNHVQIIQNHNDDGSLDTTPKRQLTGITVVGTAQHPIIYATSSDFRIGGGGRGDIDLDTNSGIITRLTWNGNSWDAVDIVRGISRSEENHAISGVEFITRDGIDYLIVTSGGHTNAGSPSVNFMYLTEYALSAALLSVNLTMLENMPILNDNGRNYIYDLPTLDDPTRANVNGITDPDTPGYDGIDINDPFGGNDGLNQAKIVLGGPVQIFSPGYRNSYDIVITESGKVLATDNGANGGWGGMPMNEGLLDLEGNSLVTNNYDPTEPGSSTLSDGEKVNNKDHLQLITNNIHNYNFGSYYGGHPSPIRANPSGAGLYTTPAKHDTTGAIFRTQKYDPDGSTPGSTTDPNVALPVDWPPVPIEEANSDEGDWRGPGVNNPDGINNNALIVWETNTNGIDEYTASNFGGALKGDLLAGTNHGRLHRVHFNQNGTVQYTEEFVAGLYNGDGLGITCNSDSDIFPGTVWVGNFANTSIHILEPQDFILCLNPDDEDYDATADYDNDGYSNQDELDNLTDPCNGGSQPQDFDKLAGGTLISDLNDPDDDNDGIPDALDPFQLGNPNTVGSDAFTIPVVNELFSSTSLGGYKGLGMTGMMNNGDTGANWLNWIDRRDNPNEPNPNDVLGGAIGAMTMQMTAGTALGINNNQEKAFQYGVKVDENTGVFKVSGAIVNFNQPLQLYGNTSAPDGELGIFIGDGTQSNYIKFIVNQTGLRVQQEIDDVPQSPIDLSIDTNNRPNSILFTYIVDPSTGEIIMEYAFDNGNSQTLCTLTAQGAILEAIQQTATDLAVGFIGTSNAVGVEVEGTWSFLNVTKAILNPILADAFPNQTNQVADVLDGSLGVNASGGDGDLIYTANGLPPGLYIDPNTGIFNGTILYGTATGIPYNVTVTIDDNDGDGDDNVLLNFTWTITDPSLTTNSTATVRINAGGTFFAATDIGTNWLANTTDGSFSSPSYSVNTGNRYASGNVITRHASIPNYIDTATFNALFASERWDPAVAPEMQFNFSLPNAQYLVNLYMANSSNGTNDPGERVFDIAVEGNVLVSGLDLVSQFGHQTGGMVSFPVTVADGTLNVQFIHGIENPLVNAIEIRQIIDESEILADAIPNQTNTVGDVLDGSLVVSASGGIGNRSFSATGLPTGVFIDPTNGQIGGSIALGAEAGSPYSVTITVDDSDGSESNAVIVEFTWTVSEPVNSIATVRLNAGGALLAATDDGTNWIANTANGSFSSPSYSVNTGNTYANGKTIARHTSIPDYIDTATFNALFANERWDPAAAPEMQFSFPLPNAQYLVNLYMANATDGTNDPGERVFDISIEGQLVKSGMDISAEFGHLTGGVVSFPVTVADGTLNIQFMHVIENPLVNAIEIREILDESEIIVNTIPNQFNTIGDILDGSLAMSATGGIGELSFSATGLPDGIAIDTTTGAITGTVATGAEAGSPYSVAITVDDSDGSESNAVTVEFTWTINVSVYSIATVRLNAGGTLFAATDDGTNWLPNNTNGSFSNTSYSVNTGNTYASGKTFSRHASIPDYIDTATFNTLFASERWDPAAAPEMQFSFPLPNAQYLVNLYMANATDGTNDPGERIFRVDIEGQLVKSGMDISAEFGHLTGGMVSFPVTVADGTLNIQFLHDIENPLVNAIEIRQIIDESEILADAIPNQTNTVGDVLNGSLMVSVSGGIGELSFSATGLPDGIAIDTTTGAITGTVATGAEAGSPYSVAITVDDSDGSESNAVIVEFTWTVSEPVNSIATVRLNAGGALLAATDDGTNWLANTANGSFSNTSYSVNTGNTYASGKTFSRHASIPDYIDTATFNTLFASERWDPAAAPEMQFSFPLPNAQYLVNLYMANATDGTNDPGERVFDISIEGQVVKTGMDISAEFGHLMGGVVSFPATVADGSLNIQFIHGIQNPLVNAIEIRQIIDESEILADAIPNQTNTVGDVLDGSLAVSASGGIGELSFSATGLPDGIAIDTTTGAITGMVAPGAEVDSPYNVAITVDDSDGSESNTVTVEFTWIVNTPIYSIATVRLNAGGALAAANDDGTNWLANNTNGSFSSPSYSVNTGNRYISGKTIARHSSIPDYINSATFNALFASERWDGAAAPEMQFSFPLPNTQYLVNLYMANATDGTNDPGERVFNIDIEGQLVKTGMDISAEFGHLTGGMVSFPVTVADGTLNIQFIHGIENPLVNAIEIRQIIDQSEIIVNAIPNQKNAIGHILDGSLGVNANGGVGDLSFSATGLPQGITIDTTTGTFTGTVAMGAETNSPYSVAVTVDDSDGSQSNAVTVEFIWTILDNSNVWFDKNENENYTSRHENSFVQAGDKFYLMGGRENSRNIDIYDYTSNTWTTLINSAPFEFNHFQATEYQGLIWVIGSFKSNGFPNEVPAEYVWSFNPASQEWIQGPEIPISRRRGSAGLVVYKDKFYVVAGNNQGHNGGYVAWYDEFDPATGQWTILPDAPRPRDHFFATVIGDKLYAAGGRLSGGLGGTFAPTIAEVDVYDFITGTWSTLPSAQNIPTPRGGASAAVFGNKLFIIGGEVSNQLVNGVLTSDALPITEIFDPEQLTWTRGSDLNHKRHGTQAIVSGGGIHILGGSTNLGGGNQKNMEFYGVDNPIGSPSVPSIISATSNATINGINGSDVLLDVSEGNIGILIRSMEITGLNAQDFEINSGSINNGLIKANSSHSLNISYTGTTDEVNADLNINYGIDSQLKITLTGILDNTSKMQLIKKNNDDLSSKNDIDFNNSDIYSYPNPTSSEAFIRVSNSNLQLSEIYINDISGRLIKTYKASQLKYGTDLYRLDVSELSNGMYFINLKTVDASVLGFKLLVQK